MIGVVKNQKVRRLRQDVLDVAEMDGQGGEQQAEGEGEDELDEDDDGQEEGEERSGASRGRA